MNHPKSMFQLSGVHYRVNGLRGVGLVVLRIRVQGLGSLGLGVSGLGFRV